MTTPYASIKLLLLIPFAALVLVYFVMYRPDPQTPLDTVVAVLLKTGPIFYLVVYVLYLGLHFHHHYDQGNLESVKIIIVLIEITSMGLVLSSVGDISLVVDLFSQGMLFFGLAHVVRIIGLSALLKRVWGFESTVGFMLFLAKSFRQYLRFKLQEALVDIPQGKNVLRHVMFLLAILIAVVVLVLLLAFSSWDVLVYYLLLLTMAGMQLFAYWRVPTESAKLGAVGGVAFVLSDTLLGLSFVKGTQKAMVMILYYFAQCALAVSAVWPPFPKKV